MAWTESHQELAAHPKTKKLKRLLGMSTPEAVGTLHMLWWWALDYAPDGDLSRFDAGDVADGCEFEGDADAFVMALIEAGFVDSDSRIHDWDDYGAKYLKRREQARERQQKRRSKDGRYLKEDGHALVTGMSRVTHALVTDSHALVTPLQDKTGEDKTGEELSAPPLVRSHGPYTDEFEKFWKDYPPVPNNSKLKAWKAWGKLTQAEHASAITSLPVFLTSDGWRKGFATHTSTFLNGKLWQDTQAAASRASPNGVVPHQQTPEEIAEFKARMRELQPQ